MTRMNIRLTEKQKRSLEEMEDKLGTTKADVIRRSLSLLAVAIRELEQQNSIAVAKNGKVVKEIIGILDV